MKSKKRFAAMLLAFAMVFSTAFVPASAAKKVTVKKVTVASATSGSSKTVYVAKGKSVKLSTTVTVTPNKKANKGVSYSVKNKKIATVSSKGVVKGKKAGTTKITVTSKKNKKKKATITVKVTKNPVTKIKLNKTKSTLNVGDSLTLKATVTAGKGACKTVNWTTSKKKVATVSSKGVVKAVGVGTATITVKAIDGSGKKATCKVTVQNPINLASMDILNAQTVTFALDKACALAPEQVSIMTKAYVNGAYKKALKIESMTTADNVNYNVIVNSDSRISVHSLVQVSIPSLSGTTKSLEKEFSEQVCAFTSDEVSTWTVGKYSTDTYSFENGSGYSEYSISGLPAGLTSEVKANSVYVKGTPTTAGATTATLTAVDEFNNTLTKNIYFVVGSDTVMAGAAVPRYSLIKANNVYIYAFPYVMGGSGNYTYEIIADPQNSGAILDANNDVRVSIGIAGDYTVTVRAKDAEDSNRYCDFNVVFHIAQGISVGGCIKDAQGNPMNVGTVYFENKNRADRYFTGDSFSVDSKGVYSATISPGTYDIEAYRDISAEAGCATNYLYNQNLTASQTGFDISLPLYKVAMVSNDQSIANDIRMSYWYIDNAYVGYGSTLYVKAGTYTIDSEEYYDGTGDTITEGTYTWMNGGTQTVTQPRSYYKYSAAVNVVNAAVQAGVTKVQTKDDTYNVTTTYPAAKDTTYVALLDVEYYVSSSNKYCAYKFIPANSGNYKISKDNVYFYNTDGSKVSQEADDSYELEAGKSYIVGTGDYDYYYYFSITEAETASN